MYRYDKKDSAWAKISVSIPLAFKRIDLTALIKELMGKQIIHEISGINRAILTEEDNKTILKTEGSQGASELYRFADMLDLNALYCNDIQMMLNTYGIEAANRVIIKEVKNVFKVCIININIYAYSQRLYSLIFFYFRFMVLM